MLIKPLSQHQASLIMQLCTGQIGLNKHFHWICCSDTPCCPSCNENAIESIHHFLFDCVHYHCEWSILHQKLRWHSYNMSYLLSHPASSSAQICSFNWQTETDIWGTLFRKPACSRHNIVHHLTGRANSIQWWYPPGNLVIFWLSAPHTYLLKPSFI